MTRPLDKRAYYRGFGGRSARHELAWYANALTQYSDLERAAFMDGFHGKPYTPQGVYGEWCRDPTLCSGKGYCPRDPTCAD